MGSNTTTVRIDKRLLDRASKLAEDLDLPVARLVNLSLEDCLDSLETKRPIVPRIVSLYRAIKRKVTRAKVPERYR